ncbi:N-acetylmuramoyl-L-alanine amidase [Sphingobacterium thalpophilum]|uniref:N-acetylmuramoyl-L-alanine amidase n=1 Tax=Sphingobacterium thalpophilum TaxID=259 RepID=UPI003C761B48
MEIKDHKITGATYRETPNKGGIIRPRYIIMHYDGVSNATSALTWMLDPKSKVSAHLHISREGSITQLAPLNVKCWHAGVSFWKGLNDINRFSIGIELQNKGQEVYPAKQIAAAVDVCKAIIAQYPIQEILGHSDIAAGRKEDPGKQFPWSKFKMLIKKDDHGTT